MVEQKSLFLFFRRSHNESQVQQACEASKGFLRIFSFQRDKINFKVQGDGLITAITSCRILIFPPPLSVRLMVVISSEEFWEDAADPQQLNQL